MNDKTLTLNKIVLNFMKVVNDIHEKGKHICICKEPLPLQLEYLEFL